MAGEGLPGRVASNGTNGPCGRISEDGRWLRSSADFNLPYLRFVIGKASNDSRTLDRADAPQNTIYDAEICASNWSALVRDARPRRWLSFSKPSMILPAA